MVNPRSYYILTLICDLKSYLELIDGDISTQHLQSVRDIGLSCNALKESPYPKQGVTD